MIKIALLNEYSGTSPLKFYTSTRVFWGKTQFHVSEAKAIVQQLTAKNSNAQIGYLDLHNSQFRI